MGQPLRAIRMYCIEQCKGNQKLAVKHCEQRECPFWLFRFGAASPYRIPELQKQLKKKEKYHG